MQQPLLVLSLLKEPVWTVGRVCCCSEGRLNDKSIVLLPPLEISNGRCLELDVSKIPEFAVFPGQILGVEGVNSVGSSLLVSRVHQVETSKKKCYSVGATFYIYYARTPESKCWRAE
jgi:hypothetical protein